jgi:hypothetical protein
MPVTISLSGARGGQGTSTTAAALALLAARRGHRVELVACDVPMMRALLGMTSDDDLDPDEEVEVVSGLTLCHTPSGDAALVISDGATPGTAETPPGSPGERTLVVLRGPCYLSLRTTIDTRDRIDGIVVVREPGRSITNRDLSEITQLPVVAETNVTANVARTIDAGVLPTTVHRRPEFAALDSYLETLEPDLTQPDPTARSAWRNDPQDRVRIDRVFEGTDLPVAQSATGRQTAGTGSASR